MKNKINLILATNSIKNNNNKNSFCSCWKVFSLTAALAN